MSDIIRLDQNQRRSRCVVHAGVAYLAGQVADDKGGDIGVQTRQALDKIDQLLAAARTDRGRLLSATIWLRDMNDFDGMNAVWDAWVVPGSAPARCCGKVELADPGFLVEIIAIAAA
jgi:enamine deaminase RidA (YjgF/YER057c/UK114 family)